MRQGEVPAAAQLALFGGFAEGAADFFVGGEGDGVAEDGQSAGARINGGVSSNKGYNGGFAAYGKGGQVDGIAIANWNTQKDYKAGDGKKIGWCPKMYAGRIGQNGGSKTL